MLEGKVWILIAIYWATDGTPAGIHETTHTFTTQGECGAYYHATDGTACVGAAGTGPENPILQLRDASTARADEEEPRKDASRRRLNPLEGTAMTRELFSLWLVLQGQPQPVEWVGQVSKAKCEDSLRNLKESLKRHGTLRYQGDNGDGYVVDAYCGPTL